MTAKLQDSNSDKAHLNEKLPNGDSGATPPRIRRAHIGVWDFYEAMDDETPRIPLAPLYAKYRDAVDCFPYILRMINDVLSIQPSSGGSAGVLNAKQLEWMIDAPGFLARESLGGYTCMQTCKVANFLISYRCSKRRTMLEPI